SSKFYIPPFQLQLGGSYSAQLKKLSETEAPAVFQRAAAELHVQSLGFTLEECPRAEAG
ncbi:hypothetical protein KUCAC02_005821, partial [Chaenocephalus aceratus]